MARESLRHEKKDALAALARRMKRGDRRAAEKLYDALFPKAYGFFFVRTGVRETAEDLSQELFVKLVEKVGLFDETRGDFVVWFWQIARHLLVDHYRAHAKRETAFSQFPDEAVEAMAVVAMPDMDHRLRFAKMRRFLDDIAAEERELFELRFVMDLSYREIAKLLGRSEGSLRIAALRLKAKIKHEI